jgi:hypothetical protein
MRKMEAIGGGGEYSYPNHIKKTRFFLQFGLRKLLLPDSARGLEAATL